jgi:phosphate transport system substrate-binding protein
MASRRIKDDEVADLQNAAFGNLRAPGAENVIALDGIVVLVSKKNPVSELSVDQLADIFSGKITDWADVGGAPGAIKLYVRPTGSGTRDTFENLVLAPKKQKFAASAQAFESSVELSEAVDGDPQGVGFVGFAYARAAKALNIGTACGKSFPPDPYLVRTEEYPLARRLYLYLPQPAAKPEAQDYVNFALSPSAQPLIDNSGFISLKIEPSSPAYALDRGQYSNMIPDVKHDSVPRLMDDMAVRIKGASRLSVTFRFETEKSDLDNRAREDIQRLADYIKQSGINPNKLMVFGFADKTGISFEYNTKLSTERARRVADELSKAGVKAPDANVKGLSLIAPVTCNDTDASLAKNRRVEIWIHK